MIDLITKIESNYLDKSDIEKIHNFFKSNESFFIYNFINKLKQDGLNQIKIDYIYYNSNNLCYDLSFLLKKHTSEHIIYLYLKNIDKSLLLYNILYKKEVYNNLHYSLQNYNDDIILNIIREICDKHPDDFTYGKEVFTLCNKLVPINDYKVSKILDRLNAYDLENILAITVAESRTSLFHVLDRCLKKQLHFSEHLKKILDDNHEICLKIINIDSRIICSSELFNLLISIRDRIPKTIEGLLDMAIQDKYMSLIQVYTDIYSNKKVLKKLYQVKDENLIKKFIENNQHSKELKELIVYY